MRKTICFMITLSLLVSVLLSASAGGVTGLQTGISLPGMTAEAAEKTTVTFVDANGDPLVGIMLSLCTDTVCTMQQTDENGQVFIDAPYDSYHWQILKAPEGYAGDVAPELFVIQEDGSILVTLTKAEN